jgi:hypothetical protein
MLSFSSIFELVAGTTTGGQVLEKPGQGAGRVLGVVEELHPQTVLIRSPGSTCESLVVSKSGASCRSRFSVTELNRQLPDRDSGALTIELTVLTR